MISSNTTYKLNKTKMPIYVKVMNDNMRHFDMKYEFGLNILKGILNTNQSMMVGEGGLYFMEIDYLDYHVYRGDFLCVVEIPDDAIVIPLHEKINKKILHYFRTDKIILTQNVYRFDNDLDIIKILNLITNSYAKDEVRKFLNDPQFLKTGRTIIEA